MTNLNVWNCIVCALFNIIFYLLFLRPIFVQHMKKNYLVKKGNNCFNKIKAAVASPHIKGDIYLCQVGYFIRRDKFLGYQKRMRQINLAFSSIVTDLFSTESEVSMLPKSV